MHEINKSFEGRPDPSESTVPIAPYEIRVLYCYSAPNSSDHIGMVKVGQATAKIPLDASAVDRELAAWSAAEGRIAAQVRTSGLKAEIHWVLTAPSLAMTDKRVHAHLTQVRGVQQVKFAHSSAQEWFRTTWEVAYAAAQDVIAGLPSASEQGAVAIVLRDEQSRFIEETLKAMGRGDTERLWNAKMRFGKTVTAMEFIAQAHALHLADPIAWPNPMHRVLVVSHRPVVNDGWSKEFTATLASEQYADYGWRYASKGQAHQSFDEILNSEEPFVGFLSMQDLRGKDLSPAKFKASNEEIFNVEWDLIIVDEAQEGNTTDLANEVHQALDRKFTIFLSGTPYKYLANNRFSEDQIDSWDYAQEQEAKRTWDESHPDEENPYASLPNIWFYLLELQNLPGGEGPKAFNLNEMLEVDSISKRFVREDEVIKFLDAITSDETIAIPGQGEITMPFTSGIGRHQHALVAMPSVDACGAMKKLMDQHDGFEDYKILNVAGSQNADALEQVEQAIGDDPSSTCTITLTVTRLTIGVTVKPWTAVVMLSNITSAEAYMQTAFRGQSPFEHNGIMKTDCAVYDFAPDRVLTVLTDVAGVTSKAGGFNSREATKALGRLLNYMPVLSAVGAKDFRRLDAATVTQSLKRIYKERVLDSGFDSDLLFMRQLELLPADIREAIDNVRVANGKNTPVTRKGMKEDFALVSNGLDDLTREQLQNAVDAVSAKPKAERSSEERATLEAYKRELTARENLRNILCTVSVRIPLLVVARMGHGPEAVERLKTAFNLAEFVDVFDDASWSEFFQNVTKDMVLKLAPAFDMQILQLAVAAWIEEWEAAFELRESAPKEFEQLVTRLTGRVKNPNKETVFTPYLVVERTYQAAGFGHDEDAALPWNDVVASESFYDINAKSGLYPLYAAIQLKNTNPDLPWNSICDAAVFANARTAAGKAIACALLGMSASWENITVIDVASQLRSPDLADLTDAEKQAFVAYFLTYPLRKRRAETLPNAAERVVSGSDIDDMVQREEVKKLIREHGESVLEYVAFDHVISNPPYQEQQGGNAKQIYDLFFFMATRIADAVCMIFPLGWQKSAGKAAGSTRHHLIREDKQIKAIDNYFEDPKNSPVILFNASTGGVNILTWKKGFDNGGQVNYSEYGVAQGHRDMSVTEEFREQTQAIIDHLSSYREQYGAMNARVTGWNPFGVPSFVTKPDRSEHQYVSQVPIAGYVPCMADRTDGTPELIYIDAEAPFIKPKNLGKWKTMMPRYGAYRIWSDIHVLAPGVAATDRFVGIYSESEAEAKNWKAFLQTDFCTFLLNETAGAQGASQHALSKIYRFIPDISTIENPRTRKVGVASSWTDTDLKKVFDLSPEHVKHIEAVASKYKRRDVGPSPDVR